jgi:hypothetical protein
MNEELRKKLAAPLPFKLLPREIKGEEKAYAFPYIETDAVVKRLNDVFGIGNWQDEYTVTLATENKVAMKARLYFRINENWSYVEGFGEATNDGSSKSLELFKTAESDALKRGARKIEIGLFLYDLPIKVFPFNSQTKRFILPLADMIREVEGRPPEPQEAGDDFSQSTNPTCAGCGAEIKGGKSKTGKEWSVQDIVDYSMKHFGAILCPTCQKKAKEAKEA